MKYYLYIIKTIDNTLYCGIALDVKKRFEQHLNSKLGAKYLKAHRPKEIVYIDCLEDKSCALKEEIRIKSLTKKAKIELIESKRKETKIFLEKIFQEC